MLPFFYFLQTARFTAISLAECIDTGCENIDHPCAVMHFPAVWETCSEIRKVPTVTSGLYKSGYGGDMIFKPGLAINMALAVLVGLPSVASATNAAVVINVGAVATPVPAVPAEPVPGLGVGLIVALGLLLAMIAYRFLRQRPAYQKILCMAALSGGTLVIAWGAGPTVAGLSPLVVVPPEEAVCISGELGIINVNWFGFGGMDITNNCATTTLEVLSYEFMPCPYEFQVKDGGADIGDTIAPGATVLANYCEFDN
ncbi:hypothetical protein [Haliea sp. E17]|uniref:hypothetical protein n=1 Tax=Haliea sp. E17 TaxID=3401576 RepID=UPI003AAB2685